MTGHKIFQHFCIHQATVEIARQAIQFWITITTRGKKIVGHQTITALRINRFSTNLHGLQLPILKL